MRIYDLGLAHSCRSTAVGCHDHRHALAHDPPRLDVRGTRPQHSGEPAFTSLVAAAPSTDRVRVPHSSSASTIVAARHSNTALNKAAHEHEHELTLLDTLAVTSHWSSASFALAITEPLSWDGYACTHAIAVPDPKASPFLAIAPALLRCRAPGGAQTRA